MLVFHVSTMNISYFSPVKISDKLTRDSLSAVARKYAAGRLIDLGCGTRPYEEIFRPHIESYFGVDFEPTADRNYGGNTNADLYRDCADTRLPEASFDTLLSTQVIEHIYDTGKYLDECLRLLKPGGAGIFTAPLIWPCHSEPYDYYRFTRYSLEKIFRDRGFEIEELTASGFSIATAAQLARFKRSQREFDQVLLDLQLATPDAVQARNSIVSPHGKIRIVELERHHASPSRS